MNSSDRSKAMKWVGLYLSLLIITTLVFYIFGLGKQEAEQGVVVTDPDISSTATIKKCETEQLPGGLSKFFPDENACNVAIATEFSTIRVLSNESTPAVINSGSILLNSKRIKISGELDEVYLYILATVEDAKYAPNRGNSVYFYIDSSTTGGHLLADRIAPNQLSANSEGVFTSIEAPKTFLIPLHKSVLVAVRDKTKKGHEPVDFMAALRPGNHMTYAFVSTPTGRILDLSIAYSCKTENCAIEVK